FRAFQARPNSPPALCRREYPLEVKMDYYDSSLETAIDHDNYLEFQQVLSDIGEALEARFVLEDKLILLVLDAARVKHPA
ncbi:Rsd/AlgQ family anti-sigma factor, partial [Escherichia coli]|uniref:Rsd/AlgQ family anti-sigma factor n=1 Tax=Escherichia coli TaxID=562 RepID=UPI001FCEC809